jgi:hypothetical protein
MKDKVYSGKLKGRIDLVLTSSTGFCLKAYQIGNQPTYIGSHNNVIIKDMFAGFANAQLDFYESIGLNRPSFYRDSAIIKVDKNKSVNMERRLYQGKKINGILFLDDLTYLDKKGYKEIDELIKIIVDNVDLEYEAQLIEFGSSGKFNFERIDKENDPNLERLIDSSCFDELDFFVNNQIALLKEQMFSNYLQVILAEAINSNVKRENCLGFLQEFKKMYDWVEPKQINAYNNTIKDELSLYYDIHTTIKTIVKKHNKKNESIWKLYEVPLI